MSEGDPAESTERDLVILAGDYRQLHAVDAVEVQAQALRGIELIAKHILDDERRDAYEAMHAIAMMVDVVRGMLQGKIDRDGAIAEIEALRVSIIEAVDRQFDDSTNL